MGCKLGCGCSVGELACLLGCGGRLVSLSWLCLLLCGCVLSPCVWYWLSGCSFLGLSAG